MRPLRASLQLVQPKQAQGVKAAKRAGSVTLELQAAPVTPAELKEVDHLEPEDTELRAGFKWQCSVVDALASYMDAVPVAFEALLQAHENLAKAGIIISDDAPDAMPLLDRLREATGAIMDTVSASQAPLQTIRGTLRAGLHDINEADLAADEYKRYCQKVEDLTSPTTNVSNKKIFTMLGLAGKQEGNTDPPETDSAEPTGKALARLERNKEKMQAWDNEACTRQARAKDVLQGCRSRQEPLLDSARDMVCSVVHAIGVASGCRPVVENVSRDPCTSTLDSPLELSFTFSYQSTRLPSPCQQFHESPLLTAAASPAAGSDQEARVSTPHTEHVAFVNPAKRTSKLAVELEAYEGLSAIVDLGETGHGDREETLAKLGIGSPCPKLQLSGAQEESPEVPSTRDPSLCDDPAIDLEHMVLSDICCRATGGQVVVTRKSTASAPAAEEGIVDQEVAPGPWQGCTSWDVADEAPHKPRPSEMQAFPFSFAASVPLHEVQINVSVTAECPPLPPTMPPPLPPPPPEAEPDLTAAERKSALASIA